MLPRLMRVFLWRPPQPALARWIEAAALAACAVAARYFLGTLCGANPGTVFFPAILIATVLLGWKEALLVLGLSIAAGWYWFLPRELSLMPVVWLVVGSLMIGIIAAFQATAQELAAANERQRILFQVARQRVARTPQTAFSVPEEAKANLSPARAEAVRILEDAARRIAGAGDAPNQAQNAALLQRELDSILRDAVASVIDQRAVSLSFDVDALELTFDLMSSVTMLVMEIANESQKLVFQRGAGSRFSVALKALPDNRAALTVKDDGAAAALPNAGQAESRRGLDVVRALVNQMHGTLRTSFASGSEFAIEFPLGRQPRGAA